MMTLLSDQKLNGSNALEIDVFVVLFVLTSIFSSAINVYGVPLRLVFLLMAFVLLLRRKKHVNSNFILLFYLSLALSSIAVLQMLIGYSPLAMLRRVGGHYLVIPVIAFLGIRIRENLSFFARVYFLIMLLLSAIAVGQAIGVKFFTDIPGLLGNVDEVYLEEMLSSVSIFRVSGPYHSTIPLTYCLSILIPWSLFIRNYLLRILFLTSVIIVTFLTGTRSLIIGVLLGLLYLAISSPAKSRIWHSLVILLLLVFSFALLNGLFLNYSEYLKSTFSSIGEDSSSSSRLDLAKAAIIGSLHFPLVGNTSYNQSHELEDFIHKSGFSTLLQTTTAHNTLLLTVAYFGYPVACFAFIVVGLPLLRGHRNRHALPSFERDLRRFNILFFIVYFSNSLFHNQGPFISDGLFWLNWGFVYFSFTNRTLEDRKVERSNSLCPNKSQ